MKKNHWITFIVGIAITLGIYAVPAVAQPAAPAQQPAPAQNLVAVIDVAQVIKQHPEFMTQQEALAQQLKQAEATFQKRQETIAAKQKALEASPHKAGSQEYQRQFDEIASDLADFEKDAKAQQRKFALANSQIMYNTYQDIKATIEKFAMAKGIMQVTDYREFEPNPADPQTVAEDMDQRLVWFNKNLNITRHIIGEIYAARGQQPPQTAPAGNAGAAPRQATAPPAPAAPAGMQQPLR